MLSCRLIIETEACDGAGHHAVPADRPLHVHGDGRADPKEFTRSPGPFARKFCPFCACDHLWHKEDSKFLAPKGAPRLRIQQAS